MPDDPDERWITQPCDRKLLWSDAIPSALLAVQRLVTFVAISLGAMYPAGCARLGRAPIDLMHLVLAAACAVALVERRGVPVEPLAGLLVLGLGLAFRDGQRAGLGIGSEACPATIVAIALKPLVTLLVARSASGSAQVTVHRIQDTVPVYLNVAALFAIAHDPIERLATGAIPLNAGGLPASLPGARTAELSHVRLATIATTGHGDLMPVDQLARSLANLQTVPGQLFPATFVARLVALHLVQGDAKQSRSSNE